MWIFAFWLIFVLCVSALAMRRNRSVLGWTLAAIFLTPLVGLILACLPTLEERPAQAADSDKYLLTVDEPKVRWPSPTNPRAEPDRKEPHL